MLEGKQAERNDYKLSEQLLATLCANEGFSFKNNAMSITRICRKFSATYLKSTSYERLLDKYSTAF